MPDQSIIARLGLDSKSFQRELAQAIAQSETGGRRISGGLSHGAEGGERLFTSGHRAASGIHRLSEELASGASAGDIFNTTLYGLERALRLPLGALAGLAIGAVLAKQIFEVRDAWRKLQEQTSVALFPTLPAEMVALDSLQERIKNINDALKKNQEAQTKIEEGGWGGFWQRIKDKMIGLPPLQPYDKSQFTPEGELKPGAVPHEQRDVAEERRQNIQRLTAERSREYTAEEAKIRRQGVNVAEKLAQLAVERAKTEMESARTVEEKQQRQYQLEQAQLDLERVRAKEATATETRLAEIGQPQGVGEMKYQRRVVAYDFGANLPQARADELKKGMAAPGDNAKDLSEAVDRSQVLKKIEKNTQKEDRSY